MIVSHSAALGLLRDPGHPRTSRDAAACSGKRIIFSKIN